MPMLNEMYPSRWLTAADLGEQDRVLTIRGLKQEEIGDDVKWVLYFAEEKKGLVLNKTNSNTIAKVYGEDADEWEGKRITLFATEVGFQGKQVPAIRVKSKPPKPLARKTAAPVTQAEADEDEDPNADVPF